MCKPVTITEQNAEFNVVVNKFFFDEYIVLEYRVKNGIPNTVLGNVEVQVTFASENLKMAHTMPADSIKADETSNILIGVAKNPDICIVSSQVSSILT